MLYKNIRGLLFDKDGTLFDFHRSWGRWTHNLLTEISEGDPALFRDLALVIKFDPATQSFLPDSPAIAGTVQEQAELMAPLLPGRDVAELCVYLVKKAAEAEMVPVVPLAPLLTWCRDAGLKLGVATNDAEGAAREQLGALGLIPRFDFIAGFDSGFGAKPGPGMCTAFAEQMALKPQQVAMIGDSTHDLEAARAAGMIALGVLSGPASREDLIPFADVILPDIGALPGWLEMT